MIMIPGKTHPHWKKSQRQVKREWPHDEKGRPIIGIPCKQEGNTWNPVSTEQE